MRFCGPSCAGRARTRRFNENKMAKSKKKRTDMAKRRGRGEGSITQRAGWALGGARVDLGWQDGQRGAKPTTEPHAPRRAAKLTKGLRDVQQGTPLPDERQTVGRFLDAWLTHKQTRLQATCLGDVRAGRPPPLWRRDSARCYWHGCRRPRSTRGFSRIKPAAPAPARFATLARCSAWH